MQITITTKNNEQKFEDKTIVILGTNDSCNYKLDLEYPVLIAIRYDFSLKNYIISNTLSNRKVLFCSNPLSKLELGHFNKFSFADSDEFLIIRINQRKSA